MRELLPWQRSSAMRIRLRQFDEDFALVLPRAAFELAGIDPEAWIEVATDGRGLRVSVASTPPMETPSEGPDFQDPKLSADFVTELRDKLGMQLDHFRRLHHFRGRA